MRRVLAIDFGPKTGWATNIGMYGRIHLEQAADSGTQNFANEITGWRYMAFKQWLDCEFRRLKIDHVIYEETFSKSVYSSRVLHGFLAILQLTFAERYKDENTRLTMAKVHALTLKKFATGSGRATKEEMIKTYHTKFGYMPIDDNEADALFLLEYSKQMRAE